MKYHIIALLGKCKSGKTTVLNLLKDSEYIKNNFNVGIYENISNNDFLAIYKHKAKNIKVGIISQGDYIIGPNALTKHLKRLIDEGCVIIICAAQENKKRILKQVQELDVKTTIIQKNEPTNEDNEEALNKLIKKLDEQIEF